MSSNTAAMVDGAQSSTTPVVGWAQLRIGRFRGTAEPGGVEPGVVPVVVASVGAMTTPETAVGFPSNPTERYSTFQAWEPAGAPARGSERMTSPGLPSGSGSGAT